MVFVSICKHASSVFAFASMSSDQIFLASSENFVNFSLAGISLLLERNSILRQVLWLTPNAKQDNNKSSIPAHYVSR